MSRFWRVLGGPTRLRSSICNIFPKRSLMNSSQPHIYKKIWKEDELIQYIKSNIVYESDSIFITSLPAGVGVTKETRWCDAERTFASDITVMDLVKVLRLDSRFGKCYSVRCPKRSASGLAIFAKSDTARKNLLNNFEVSSHKGVFVFGYLAVVMGQPSQILVKDFGVKTVKTETGLNVEIRDISLANRKFLRVSYQHEVLCSTEHVSLVKVEVSTGYNDCVRHILAEKCCSPVFGDSWNGCRKQGFMFGVPLVRDPSLRGPYVLPQELLEKLQLEPGDEKYIPPHLHVYSLKLPVKNNTELFASVPPPECFIWTCNQLGLNEIEKFALTKLERNKMSVSQD